MTHKKFLLPVCLSACSLMTFIVITYMITQEHHFWWDVSLHDWLATWPSQLEGLINAASYLGATEVLLFATLVALLWLWLKNNRAHAWLFFIVMGGGVTLNLVLKFIIQRARPGDEIHVLHLFGAQLDIVSYSFPSGHAMRAFLFYGFLIYLATIWLHRRFLKTALMTGLVTAIVVIGLSRITLEAHYPSDIIAAYAASLFWLCLCILLFQLFSSVTREAPFNGDDHPRQGSSL